MSSIRERNKELILRAASEEFADKGFAASKTSDIAAKAGVPKPNVYYYFKSKENLYREVLESIIEPILRVSTPFNADGEPNEVLSNYIRSKILISRELPFASKVFASEIMHGAPHLSEKQVELLNDQAKHNIACIQTWIDRGLIAPIDPHHLMFSIWAATSPPPTSTGRFPPSPARPSSTTATTKPRPRPLFGWCLKAARRIKGYLSSRVRCF